MKRDMIDPDTLYTMQDAADVIGLSRVTLYRYVKAGKIETVKIGMKKTRIPGDELLKLISTQSLKNKNI